MVVLKKHILVKGRGFKQLKLTLPKKYNRKIVKAIAEFNLIEEGDKILVGLSGGKDSAFLLYALKNLQLNLALDFQLAAMTIDLGFGEENHLDLPKEYCKNLGVPFFIEKTRIGEYLVKDKGKNPCARCSYLRKGAMVEFMKKKGFNKVAYGHHYDDAVETFLLSIIYSGQILTLQPKRYLPDNDLYIIRPMIYLREKEIIEGQKLLSYRKISSSCPYEQDTKRAEIKGLISEMAHDKQIFYNLVAAMREGGPIELWPERISKEEINKRIKSLWNG